MRAHSYRKISKYIRAQRMRNNPEILSHTISMAALWGIRHDR